MAASAAASARPLPSHTKISSESILNSLPEGTVKEIFDDLRKKAIKVGDCLFPHIRIKNGEYPRYSINKKIRGKIQDPILRDLAMDANKIRIPYHLIAWRASGKIVPVFGTGNDISHKCRKGQMRVSGATEPSICSEVHFGCFSSDCLEMSTHADNLDRGRCIPIVECQHCKLLFINCDHTPVCGTTRALQETFDAQKKIKRIRIEYEDGSESTIE